MSENKNLTKRDLILKAALGVFSERGFHKAKIEDIAQEAGVGKGTVYEYFTSKEQLFREMLMEGINCFNNALAEELRHVDTVQGKLTQLVEKNIEVGWRYRHLAKIALLENSLMDEPFRQWFLDMHGCRIKTIEDIVKEGVVTGEITHSLDPHLFAKLFYGSLGAIVNPVFGLELGQIDASEIAQKVVQVFLKGIATT